MAALKTPEREHVATVPLPCGENPVFAVEGTENGTRLDRFLAERLRGDGFSREKIKRLIREGKVSSRSISNVSASFARHFPSSNDRFSFLGGLVKIALSDEQFDTAEINLLYEAAIALGFSPNIEALGMGNAYYTKSDSKYAPFYNPADPVPYCRYADLRRAP